MLAKLKLYISSGDFEITYHISSLLHGAMMSIIKPEYAEFLHSGGLNPFSINLKKDTNGWCWTVATVGKEPYENIIKPLLDESFIEFTLIHKNNALVKIDKKILYTESVDKLFSGCITSNTSNNIKLEFSAPTAFKSKGELVTYPDLHLIYHSLMKKAQLISSDISFDDNETLKALENNSKIVAYSLKTVVHHVEGRRITGFVGYIIIQINGPAILRNFAETLFEIGSYLGVGMKASLGMGAINLIKTKEVEPVEW